MIDIKFKIGESNCDKRHLTLVNNSNLIWRYSLQNLHNFFQITITFGHSQNKCTKVSTSLPQSEHLSEGFLL